ncbi:MAG: globin domain-containing protein [Acidimicrobiales bacterium]
MRPEQLDLVNASSADVTSDPRQFSTTFYDTLFKIAPELRSIFSDNMVDQRKRLMGELGFLISSAQDLDRFTERARTLGGRHVGYGVQPADYKPVKQAFLASVGEAIGSDCPPELIEAWEALIDHIAKVMKQGAADTLK